MRVPTVLFALLLATLLPACATGPKPVKVAGKIVYKDQPLKIDPKGSITVRFNAIENSDAFSASVREDMTFDVPGPKGEGIPAGKYRIMVLLMVPEPTAETNEINARFTQQDSQIIREIPVEGPLVLDLSNPDGK